jgi:eukaryotic translation initiation factor 2-alpha kinase 4
VLRSLRVNDFSAELCKDTGKAEELLQRGRGDFEAEHSYLVIVKQDMLKVKALDKGDSQNEEMAPSKLIPWLRSEMRERGQRAVHAKQASSTAGVGKEREQEVDVMVALKGSKKFNRQGSLDQARTATHKLMGSMLEGGILAIETSDNVLDKIRTTALTDTEGWRSVEQGVPQQERQYIREIREWLEDKRAGKGSKHAFVYNFRTQYCVYYDLKL